MELDILIYIDSSSFITSEHNNTFHHTLRQCDRLIYEASPAALFSWLDALSLRLGWTIVFQKYFVPDLDREFFIT